MIQRFKFLSQLFHPIGSVAHFWDVENFSATPLQLSKRLLAGIVLSLLLSQCAVLPSATDTVSVSRIADGDTLTAVDHQNQQIKVRFACVDAPEVPHSQKEKNSRSRVDRNQFQWGDRARARLERLVKSANNQIVLTITDTDQYGRNVAEVRLPDGTFVQQVLAQEGLVMAYRDYYRDCPSSALIDQAEAQAKQQKAGVWGDQRFTPPWQYRSRSK